MLKAIEVEEKSERDQLRQGEFGGVSGGFYQGGNAGTGAGTTGAVGGNQEEDGDEEDDEEQGPTTPGPGAFGVLSGLFGIFSGLGTLNPSRIIQSTVNFFPPSQRMQAQMIVDSLIGYVPPENGTLRPTSNRPRTTPISLLPNETLMVITMTGENSAAIEAKTKEVVITKDAENMTNNASVALRGEAEQENSGAKGESNANLPTTTTTVSRDTSNVYKLLSQATPLPLPVHEDDEVDLEKRLITTQRPGNSTKPEYKVKSKVTTANGVQPL